MFTRLNKEWNGRLGLDKAAKITLAVVLIDVAFVLLLVWRATSTS